MGRMKAFLMQVSEDIGHGGEINDEVVEEAQDRLAMLADKTHDELNEPEEEMLAYREDFFEE